MMCDSPIVQTKLSQSDSLCKYSHSSISCDSEFQSEVVKDDSLSKVQRLEQQLLEEIELRAILENAIEKNATKFSSPACLPYNAQELLSIIAAVEVTVSELEQELVALHFQPNQERNERRLAEYRLRHPSPRSMSPRPSSIMKLPISSSRVSADHPRLMIFKQPCMIT